MSLASDAQDVPLGGATAAARHGQRHLIIRTFENLHFIISAPSFRSDVALIQIDPYSGSLVFLGIPNVDLFPSVRLAKESLEQRAYRILEEIEVEALVGYIVVRSEGYLVAVAKSREEVTLPGGAVLRTVLRTATIRVPLVAAAPYSLSIPSSSSPAPHDPSDTLPSASSPLPIATESTQSVPSQQVSLLAPPPSAAGSSSRKPSVLELLEGVFDFAYYYCETADATAHFPNLKTEQNFESEFCWNEWLTVSFERAGLRRWPVALLHGCIGWRSAGPTQLAMLTRKSRRNPSMGTETSGLNKQHGVGNEWEYELLVWAARDADSLALASYVWRTGVVPVWWRADYTRKAEQRVQMTSAEPSVGSEAYISNLAARHDISGGLTLLSLLGGATHESLLANAYREAMTHVRHKLNLPVSMLELDWTRLTKELGPTDAVGRYWELLHATLKGTPVSVSVLSRSNNGAGPFRVLSQQNSLLRFNSFDGSERAVTAMTCFAMQAAVELCGVVSGRPAAGWAGLRAGFEKTAAALDAPLLEALVHFFAYQSQLVAWYYGTSAPKQPFMLSQFAAAGTCAAAEALLTHQRAAAGDRGCHADQLSAVLGGHRDVTNALSEPHSAVVSLYPAWALVPLPAPTPAAAASSAAVIAFTSSPLPPLLSQTPHRTLSPATPVSPVVPCSSVALCAAAERPGFVWSRADCNAAELTFFLREPCIVTELVLHVPDRMPPGAFPQLLDVCCGDYLDRLDVIFQSIALPRLEGGGRLHYKFPSAAESRMFNHLYKFEPLTFPFQRVLQLCFRGATGRMVLGRVDVLGIPARPNASRHASLNEMHQQRTKEQVELIVSSLGSGKFPNETDSSPQLSPHAGSATSSEVSVTAPLGTSPQAHILPSYPSIDRLPSERQEAKQPLKHALSLRSVEQPPSPQQPIDGALAGAERQYIEFIQRKFAPQLSLLDALKIDLLRLQLQLTPQQRNLVLLRLGLHIDSFNPSTYVYHHDEKLENYKRKLDRWKTTRCSSDSCQAALGFLRRSAYQCAYCYRFFCHSCMSSVSKRILEFMWTQPQPVCRGCCSVLSEQEDILCEIQGLVALEKRKESASIAHQMILSDVQCAHDPAESRYTMDCWRSLAQYPAAGILYSVPTHPQSAPVETILFPPHVVPPHAGHWCAPEGVRSVTIAVVLAAHCLVQKMALLVDPLGYSAADVPIIKISAGFSAKQLRMVDFWPLPSSGPIAPGEWLEFAFKQPFECRVLSLALVLPDDDKTAGRLLHLGRVFVSGQPLAARLEDSLSAEVPLAGASDSGVQRTKVVPQDQQFRPAQRMLDMQLRAGSVVAGFTIAPRRTEDSLPLAWPRILHVTALKNRNEPDSLRQLGRFYIPRMQPPMPLSFYFVSLQEVAQISIEFVAAYSAAPLHTPPRIDLFNTSS